MEMGPDQESQDVKECQVVVSFFSDTPVVGCAVKPNVRVRVEGSVFQPPHSLCCTWYREQVKCSVHHSVLASLQCISCEKLKMPFKKSYHCSPECFVAAWKEHLARHRIMTETINSTAISDLQETKILRSCGSWSDLGSAMVVEGDWVKVGSLETYEPSEDDTGFRLRLESLAVNRSTGTPMSPINIAETNPVITFPPRLPRCMIQLEKFRTICPSSDVTFNVLSYNILADMYASISAKMQSYCPTWALAWDYRRKNLLSEIIEYNADIICLQEVQSDHFENFFKPELTKLGYSVMFKAKKKGVYAEKGEIFEGCATFFRRLLFKEVIRYELEFANTTLPLVDALGPEQKTEACIRLIKDNVAIVVVLEAIENGNSDDGFRTRICVANTHIHANPMHPDVKLCQVADLVHGLEKIVESQVPLLICADLNSLPESDPHKFLVRGGIDSLRSTKETDPLGLYKHLKLKHPFVLVKSFSPLWKYLQFCWLVTGFINYSFMRLIVMLGHGKSHLQVSAYASLSNAKGIEEQHSKRMDPSTFEPLFTHHTPRFSGTLDYIFYSADKMRLLGVLELVDGEMESVRHGLPSAQWSSDHLL
ncbi:hypothetical protein EZV62_021973 [Acer yangbiense]|uniref:Endonuclease/exonuclease/phosphatase domain-containing protein n=1 Tax=Acer yangbiense TaxID=1000413 RepID=A0A5C7H745_9ROSI|nr:hypothetical protein EZV62_021973 [Acer yangbiense]